MSVYLHINEETVRRYQVTFRPFDHYGYRLLQSVYPTIDEYQQISMQADIDRLFDAQLDYDFRRVYCLMRLTATQYYDNTVPRLVSALNRTSSNTPPSEQANLHPIAVRYLETNGTTYVERFPFQMTVSLSDANRKPYIEKDHDIRIWIPWTLSTLSPFASGMSVYYSDHSLQSFDDFYIVGAMPNTYSEGNICWGDSLRDQPQLLQLQRSDDYDLKHSFNHLFNEYFNGGWNTDLGSNLFRTVTSLLQSNYQLLTTDSRFAMVHQFVFPTTDYINERLPHVSAARRRMLAQGMTAVAGYSHIKQLAYVLYMLSTFSLEDTLEFYRQLFLLQQQILTTNPHHAPYNIYSFGTLLSRNQHHNSIDDGVFDWHRLFANPLGASDSLFASRYDPTQLVSLNSAVLYSFDRRAIGNGDFPSYNGYIPSIVPELTNRVLRNMVTSPPHDDGFYLVDEPTRTVRTVQFNAPDSASPATPWGLELVHRLLQGDFLIDQPSAGVVL